MIKSWGHEWHFTCWHSLLALNSFLEFQMPLFCLTFPWYLLELLSLRDPECVLQPSNTAWLSFPENCHSVCHILGTFRDVQFGFLSIYIIAGSYPIVPLNTSAISARSPDWPNLAALLPGNPGPYRLHNSPSQEVSLYFFFSLVLLSVNTSTLTGVAIFISLIEE